MSNEDVGPCVVFVSCSDDLEIGKLVDLVAGAGDSAGVRVWDVNTKYYEATVNLFVVGRGELDRLKNDVNLQEAGGLVLYYDGDFQKSSEDLKSVQDFARDLEADVKLLVCDFCSSEGSRTSAEEWSVQEGFEHLEIAGDDGDSDRLKQALEAHVWPNMITKPAATNKKTEKTNRKSNNKAKEDDLDDFSTLFEQLATMKEQAAGLPPEERKNFAEQVVLAYWRSIGGDEEELLDL
uniref:Alpha-and gamma-adaptin-binding protein p34 n=1 Tax=Lygus hesperus TaxID=30085 RepID=A0A0A9WW96_LYGHE